MPALLELQRAFARALLREDQDVVWRHIVDGGFTPAERLNIRRAVYDQLKAILTNCVRHGPLSQNRVAHTDFRSHLLGRIAHVQMIHPARGVKLRSLFEQIVW